MNSQKFLKWYVSLKELLVNIGVLVRWWAACAADYLLRHSGSFPYDFMASRALEIKCTRYHAPKAASDISLLPTDLCQLQSLI